MVVNNVTEWMVYGIVATIIGSGWTIVRSIAGIVKPLTEQITKLNDSIESITKDMNELTERNSRAHSRLFQAIEDHSKILNEYEIRLVKLEEHEGK